MEASAFRIHIWSSHSGAVLAFFLPVSKNPWLMVALAFTAGVVSSTIGFSIAQQRKRHPETEGRFRHLVESLPDAIMVLRDEVFVYINPAGMKMLGAQRREQIVGKSLAEIVHPDSLESARLRARESPRTGVATSPKEHLLLSLDGSVVEIESTSIPVRWNGAPGIVAVARDIRSRKRIQARLKEYEKVVEGLDEMIAVVDREYRYLIANRAFLSYRGMTRDQVIGRTVREIVLPGVFDSVIQGKLEECFGGKVVKYDLSYEYPEIGRRELFISYYPIDEGHGITRIACVLQDVTERKQAEQSLRESQAEVVRVTRALTMGELAASIAHEVNQPLTAVVADVSASLHWLIQTPPDLKEVRTALLAAVHNANRASGIVAGVRARLQHTAPPLQRLEPSLLILDVLAMVRQALVDSGIEVTTELAPNTPRILGNRLELEQVVLNLIMNAIDSMKAVPDRPRKLSVISSKCPEGVLIQIQDNGVGFDPTWADRMFEPLFTTKPTGIGMGLSISRSIVEGHSGRLWATPNSPHGASFQFTLQDAEEYYRG